MKQKLFLLIFSVCTCNFSYAQPPIAWQKCLGSLGNDEANSIHQTNDGGLIVAGSSAHNSGDVTGNHGVDDFWIVKLNSSGSIEWQKSLGSSAYDMAYSIDLTSSGGYIVA